MASPALHKWAAKYDARVINKLEEAKKYPDEKIAYETRNFGWIFSACDKEGKRKIIAKA